MAIFLSPPQADGVCEIPRFDQENNIISCFDYYRQPQARELAHRAKSGDNDALLKMAKQMSLWIPSDSILVPTRSRDGVATDSLVIANEISRLRKVIVKDVVIGPKRESLYNLKKSGNDIPKNFFQFILISNKIKTSDNIYIVDTVFDTGITTSEILKLIPNAKVLTHSRVNLFDKEVITLQRGGLKKAKCNTFESPSLN